MGGRAEEPHTRASFRGWGRQRSPAVNCLVSRGSMALDCGPPACKIRPMGLTRKEGDGTTQTIASAGDKCKAPSWGLCSDKCVVVIVTSPESALCFYLSFLECDQIRVNCSESGLALCTEVRAGTDTECPVGPQAWAPDWDRTESQAWLCHLWSWTSYLIPKPQFSSSVKWSYEPSL